jgi:hypothetical protein
MEKKSDVTGLVERQNVRIKALEDKINDFEQEVVSKLHEL